jgi:bifunctional non-homologous end joining protein LigD
VADKLAPYRQKRDARRTPEPVPAGPPVPVGNDDTFVIQEHHARRLHWDVRLERGGVLVSWAVPKGLPLDPKTNHLAVHTEDHPLEYATFEGEIPRGEYGGGTVLLWDRGRYTLEKWTDDEVKVVFDGSRARGRYVFFRLRDQDWMVHRMDPPPREDWRPVPETVRPMRPVAGVLPAAEEDDDWAYEMDWGGERTIVIAEAGRARGLAADGVDVTAQYPELRALGEALGSRACVLDGEVVALDGNGRPDPSRLRQRRSATTPTQVRRVAAAAPVTFLAFDLLHLDGSDTTELPYAERRRLLDGLGLQGPRWAVSLSIAGGPAALAASREFGLAGVIAKRRASTYRPGRRSGDWRVISSRPVQDVVVIGWLPATGSAQIRDERPAALLLAVRAEKGLRYVGTVRAGLTSSVQVDLARRLRRLARATPAVPVPSLGAQREARWVRPFLTGRVSHDGWTADGRLRRAAWLGLA